MLVDYLVYYKSTSMSTYPSLLCVCVRCKNTLWLLARVLL